jgi:hypothetical protein
MALENMNDINKQIRIVIVMLDIIYDVENPDIEKQRRFF